MKNVCFLSLFSLSLTAFVFSSCVLEKEPSVPEGADNILSPGFLSSELAIVSDTIIQTTAQLSSPGNLNILHHGWVWGKNINPTLQDNSLDSGRLSVQVFSIEFSGLEPGEVYHFRPYVTTGCETVYGDDHCIFLGVNFTIDFGTVAYLGSEIQFMNKTPGNSTYLWDFGDGNTSSEVSPKHTYTNTGIKTVRLTANNSGCSASKTLTLTVLTDPFDNYLADIPGGTFMMGCTDEQNTNGDCDDDEAVVHEVTVPAFRMGKTEVTQRQWQFIMGSNNNPSFFNQNKQDYPVEQVTWNDVQVFIDKLNMTVPAGAPLYRLPTEAEWEYAARGNQALKYSGSNDRDSVGWSSDNSGDSTHEVRMRMMNGFGLYDMSGNVWEWVEDFYHDSYDGAPNNGTAWLDMSQSTNRVRRGGAWRLDPTNCRTANRASSAPGSKDAAFGFRLARSY